MVLPAGEVDFWGHGVHPTVPPHNALYVFASQATHAGLMWGFGIKPGAHTQSTTDALPPVGVVLEAGHAEHKALPRADLYVPDAHSVHDVGVAPVHPGLHWQSLMVVAPNTEIVLCGHDIHSFWIGSSPRNMRRKIVNISAAL